MGAERFYPASAQSYQKNLLSVPNLITGSHASVTVDLISIVVIAAANSTVFCKGAYNRRTVSCVVIEAIRIKQVRDLCLIF